MNTFELHSKYQPAGDQPKAIEGLVKSVKKGTREQTLLGVTGSGKSVVKKTPVLIKNAGKIRLQNIGEHIDRLFHVFSNKIQHIDDTELISAEDLPKGFQFETYSFDPVTKQSSWKAVTQFTRHKAPEELFKITTTSGREVTVTGNHNFFVLKNQSLELLESASLQAGDFLPVPLSIPEPEMSEQITEISIADYFPQKHQLFVTSPDFVKAWSTNEDSFRHILNPSRLVRSVRYGERLQYKSYTRMAAIAPEITEQATLGVFGKKREELPTVPLTDNFLRLLGYYIAEGHAEENYFILSAAEKEIISDFQTTLAEMKLQTKLRPDTHDFVIASKVWSQVLQTMTGKNAKTKHLPNFWPQLPKAKLAELLKAYFSADGGVTEETISCATASEQLASDLSYALLRFGVVSRTRKRLMKIPNTDRFGTYWELHISGKKNLDIFAAVVSFTLGRKNEKLKTAVHEHYNTNIDVIPVTSWIKNIRQKLSLSQKDLCRRDFNEPGVTEIKSDHPNRYNSPNKLGFSRNFISLVENGLRLPSRNTFTRVIGTLKNAALSQNNSAALVEIEEKENLLNLFWTKIKKIELSQHEEYVYDFAVQDNETFLAGSGGLFVHNTFTMSNIVAQIQKPTLVIAHNKTLAAQLASEFAEFFPNNAVHYFVSYYDYYQPEAYIPRSDTYIEKETQINEEIDRLRNAATQSLLTRKDVLIVASVSCIYGLGDPQNYEDLSLELVKKTSFKRDKLLRRLTDMQFARNDVDLHRGTFRVRGDIIEIVPASSEIVVRISFYGDDIERISEHDLLTGEDINELEKITIFPAKHFVTPKDKLERAIDNIRAELAEQIAKFRSEGKILEAQRIEQRTNFDIETLVTQGYVNGIENYSRQLDFRKAGDPPSTLLDYFPDDFLMFIDESHMTIPQINGMYHGDRSRKENLVNYGFRLPSAMDNRPLKFEEFEKKVSQVVYVSATPAKFEIERTQGTAIVEQLVRPTGLIDPTIEIKPIKNQVDDLLHQIQERVKKHQRVIATTLTKRMAEELSEYLKELGIAVQYLHSEVDTFERLEILRDLRLGIYDVIVGINLLREGLDLPEVSLVAILDTDKEGFLRSETALMQIMGRAARHVDGHVIMYADRITGSMQRAIDETTRRRKIQIAYNKKNGITPQTIQKEIKDTRLSGAKNEVPAIDPETHDLNTMDKREFRFYIDELEERMDLAARNLEYEMAAKIRDRISEAKKLYRLKK